MKKREYVLASLNKLVREWIYEASLEHSMNEEEEGGAKRHQREISKNNQLENCDITTNNRSKIHISGFLAII
ncbi:poly A polymerase [Cryptosporidium felis]|nr:poly A polymerase [Cryptosporidium felis]